MDKTQRTIRWVTGAVVGMAILSVVGSIIFVQAHASQAAPPGRTGPRRPGPGGPAGPGRMFGPGVFRPRIPDLTDAQREQIRGITERRELQGRPLMEQLRAARLALAEAIAASPVDEAAIRQKSAEVATVEAELAVIRAYVNAEVRSLLTPEQLQQLHERRNRLKERRAGRSKNAA